MTPQLSPGQQTVYDCLCAAADTGATCPTNKALADQVGTHSFTTIIDIFKALEIKGLIMVQRYAVSRVVTIVDTGKATAGMHSEREHWRVAGAKNPGAYTGLRPSQFHRPMKPRVEDIPTEQFVDRDPCPRCGVRADYGCRHQPHFSAEAA
jgi:hypothetical protein